METQEQLPASMDIEPPYNYFQFNRKIGCAIFDRHFLLSPKRKILSQQIVDALQNKDKRLAIVHYNQQWAEVFNYMQFCEVDELFIYLSDCPQIIRDISHTVFRNISQMHLNNNNIKSIEALAKMNLRTLYVLDLCVNQITSIAPLVACNFPCLAGLYLKRNRILSMEPLKQCSMPFLDIVRLECYEDNVMDYDISWASRINSRHVREICVESEYRICQLKHRRMLRKKYAKIAILINNLTILQAMR